MKGMVENVETSVQKRRVIEITYVYSTSLIHIIIHSMAKIVETSVQKSRKWK